MSDSAGVRPVDIGPLPRNYDAATTEAKWRAEWQKLGLYDRDRNAPRERTFAVDSPPPTVSGSLHVGHVFSYTHQDVVVRYRRMRGWNICYPMGWDDNGLPTERRVQNYFNVRAEPGAPYIPGLKVTPVHERDGAQGKRQDEPSLVVSRQNFIELCHRVTALDEVVYRDLFQRLGLSVDWREEYATIDDRCRRIAQRSFLDLWQKGHVYQVESPTMWDVDFQTAVAQAEVEDREKQGAFHDIEFGVEGGGSFVISTTRPELLAACVGVACHPDDPRYRRLVGKHAVTPAFWAHVPIFGSELVEEDKGTGILMVCTFGDQTDVQWWREHNLALRQVINRDGRIRPMEYGRNESLRPELAQANHQKLVGQRVNGARRLMVEMLRDPANSALSAFPTPSQGEGVGVGLRAPLQTEPRPVTHSVRFYEKGESPLEYLTTRQWFVRLTDKKDRLLEVGRRIHWRPEHMLKRYENWVENLNVDWCVSRQRYFGVPIPVWYPLDAHGQPRYSEAVVAAPEQLPVDPMTQAPPGYDEQRRGRPGGFAGEQDVFDTWFTSSLTPQIVGRWGDPDGQTDQLFPMDLRPQGHDIIRTWAFYTIVKAMLHAERQEDEIPWRNIMLSGWILDPERKKMSKSKGNVVTPVHLLDQYGADAVRYWAASARLGADTAFDEQGFKVGKRLVTKLFNAGRFVLQQTGPLDYARGDVGHPSPQPSPARGEGVNKSGPLSMGEGANLVIVNELDRAFVAELRDAVRRATEALEEYEFAQALEVAESFFWSGFTDNYIELVKARARSETDPSGRASAVATLRLGLSTFLRLFAPFVPNICDEVWSWAFATETGVASVHAAPWPSLDSPPFPPRERVRVWVELPPTHKLDSVPVPGNPGSFAIACNAIAAVRKAKTEAGISLGAPLVKLTFISQKTDMLPLRQVLPDVESAAGVKSADVAPGTLLPDLKYRAEIEFTKSAPSS